LPRDVEATAREIRFSDFIFYPAQTWPHKNHLNLIEALALLRDRFGIVIPLVSSGKRNAFYQVIKVRVASLALADQVQFLDYVSEQRLGALFSLARAVVIPTKFESLSLPIWEAFAAGRAVACSNVTSLPMQVAGAALLFDPNDVESMALAIRKIWEDDALRAELSRKGRERMKQFPSDRPARHFRAIYRSVLGRGLTTEDEQLLAEPPML
jgi:glycosyltransferase involved in cell wall biosynthesis